MVNYSPKWNLPAEEAGDPSDMPAATGRLRAAVEAALDKALGQAVAGVAGKMDRTGDTMTGSLVIASGGGVKVTAQVDPTGYDVGYGPGGSFMIGRGGSPILMTNAGGTVTLTKQPILSGVPQSAGGAEIADSTLALVKLASGQVTGFTRTAFALWLNLAPSTRRIKTGITPASPVGVLGVEPVTFRYKPGVCADGGAAHLGVIAEQVAETFPAAVVKDSSGLPEGVDVMALVAGLIHEVRQLRDRVAVLEGIS